MPRAKNRKVKSRRSKFLRYFIFPLVAIAIIVGVVWWQWSNITSSVTGGVDSIWRALGGGLVIIVLALAILVVILALRKQYTFVRRWYRWVGLASLALAIWGILAFANVGGSVGLGIIGSPGILGGLKVAGLILLGILLFNPYSSLYQIKRIIASIKKRREKEPVESTAPPKAKAAIEAEMAQPVEPKSVREAKEPAVPRTPEQAKQSLKQVAQEVWKKYGKSSSLATVDGWKLPPLDILDKTPEVEFSQADNARRARLIEESLASYGVEAKVVQINTGPTVTQFGVEPGWARKYREVRERDNNGNVKTRQEEIAKTRIKVERILALSNDLALSLAASSIRIEAPVPGKSIIGIEVPNTVSTSVSLRGVIETGAFQKAESKSKLTVALGKGPGGESVAADMAKMPHLLIAGATGSGKTVCLNALVCALLMYNAPSELQFIMIDPKRVELTPYNSIPHLASPVIVDTNKAIAALRWLSQEMDRRYEKFAKVTVRNIEGYNKNRQQDGMPYLVVIIDELADLMMAGFDEVEHLLCRLAQLSRATGIHLVVATQRPSVDVVTGLIKANFPTRISFAVTSQVDSRTILDGAGAEKLLGKGDMLYMPTEAGKPKRLQGCYVSDPEIERLVYFWNSQQTEEKPSLKIEELPTISTTNKEDIPPDALLDQARLLLQEHKQISASFLQRKLRIGYPRAARLMEQLEEEAQKGGGETGQERP